MVLINVLGSLAWQLSATAFVYTVFFSRASMIPVRRFWLSWAAVLPAGALFGFWSPAAPWLVGGGVAAVSLLGALVLWQGTAMVNWRLLASSTRRESLSYGGWALRILAAIFAAALAVLPSFYVDSNVPATAGMGVLAVCLMIIIRRLALSVISRGN